MIRVTIEIVPNGIEAQKKVIGRMEIANIGGTESEGDYSFWFKSERWNDAPLVFVPGVIRRFPRSRRGVWALILEALDQTRDVLKR